MGSVGWGETAGIIAGVSLIWHAGMYIGILMNKISHAHIRLDGHDSQILDLRESIQDNTRMFKAHSR